MVGNVEDARNKGAEILKEIAKQSAK